jgi:hypothetical protein
MRGRVSIRIAGLSKYGTGSDTRGVLPYSATRKLFIQPPPPPRSIQEEKLWNVETILRGNSGKEHILFKQSTLFKKWAHLCSQSNSNIDFILNITFIQRFKIGSLRAILLGRIFCTNEIEKGWACSMNWGNKKLLQNSLLIVILLVVRSCRRSPKFRRNVSFPSPGLRFVPLKR